MVRAGLGYLAAAGAAQLPAATQAECLRELEQDAAAPDRGAGRVPGRVHRRAGARRGRGLQRGVLADPPHRHHPRRRRRAHRLGQAGRHAPAGDRGARRRAVSGVRRAADLPVDRQAAPEYRDAGDEQLLAAFAGGLGLADLAALFAEMYVQARGNLQIRTRAGSSPTAR